MFFYLIGLAISLAAGLWFVLKPPHNKKWIYLFLSAGGAFLMTIIFTHILPELFERIPNEAGYFLLAGFLIQILLENYSRGIEHGHSHTANSSKVLYVSYLALCIHAIIEGMPMASFLFDSTSVFHEQLTVGIMLHKIPVAITLAMLLSKSGIQKKQSTIWITGFILCTVIGSSIQYFIGETTGEGAADIMFMSLGLTIGILLHVSTTILFESSDHHRLSPSRIAVIAIGIVAGLLA
ncbi:ZIP family metal transporter [bacterium]|nr:ZIP family metal transporter [bacterium]